MRTFMVMATLLLASAVSLPAFGAPRASKKKPTAATVAKAKPAAASQPSFWVVSCASECLPKGKRLFWTDGWTAADGKKLSQELERTCVADLKVAGCAKPKCSCRAKLAAAPASQPASAPASQRTAKLATKKPPRPTTDDLPRPSEARVEAFP